MYTLKDHDILYLLERNQDLINIEEEDRTLLIQAISDDASFLSSFNIMDYSLLLGIETLAPNRKASEIPTIQRDDFIEIMGSGRMARNNS